MKHNLPRQFLLLTLPLAILVTPMLYQHWQKHKTIDYGFGGGSDNDATGERGTLAAISYNLHKYPSTDAIRIGYTTPEADGKYLPQVRRGHRSYAEWAHQLEYNRRAHKLTKKIWKDNQYPNASNQIWIWSKVSEKAIHQVSAHVSKLTTITEIAAYKGGNISELKKYGAILETP